MSDKVDMSGFAYTGDSPEDTKQLGNHDNPFERPEDGKTTAADLSAKHDALADQIGGEKSLAGKMLSDYGTNANDRLNRGTEEEARQNGWNKNFQYGEDTVTQSPFADFNGMSWDETQRLSRLADAYNNRHRLQPGQLGMAGEGMTMNQFTRNDAIDTEETRRARMTERGEETRQQNELGRANELLAYPQKLTEQFDRIDGNAQAAAITIQQNWADMVRRGAYDTQYKRKFEIAVQKDLLYWTREMQNYEGGKVATILYNELNTNPQFGQWMASTMTNSALPNPQEYIAGEITAQIMQSSLGQGFNWQDTYTSILKTLGNVTGVTGAMNTINSTYSNFAQMRSIPSAMAGAKQNWSQLTGGR